MIAAIYARKSTDQGAVSDEARSVTRQVEHARTFAASKGWTVDDAHVYVDDGISGAEFAARPGFVRLLNALKPRAPFDVLIMSEESRLGREAIETAYAMKQLIQAGVRIWFYLEGRERTLDSPTDKLLMSVTAFADELEREKARQRTYDAMIRKARAGHVTGGRVFGYDNVEISNADGTRAHVVRRINEAEAAVVRRIFEMSAAGVGLTRITKALNADRALAPRAQQGRPHAWASSSVRAVLLRPLYAGQVVWNQTASATDGAAASAATDRPPTSSQWTAPTCASCRMTCGGPRRRSFSRGVSSTRRDSGWSGPRARPARHVRARTGGRAAGVRPSRRGHRQGRAARCARGPAVSRGGPPSRARAGRA